MNLILILLKTRGNPFAIRDVTKTSDFFFFGLKDKIISVGWNYKDRPSKKHSITVVNSHLQTQAQPHPSTLLSLIALFYNYIK